MKRVKGKLIKWDSDKAFGFIAVNNVKSNIFIHKTAFANRQRVPAINDIITFSLSKDEQGRVCANDATFTGEKLPKKKAKRVNVFSIYLAIIFLTGIAGAFFLGYLSLNITAAYFGMSLVTFMIYGYDKSQAQRNGWRTKESSLHLFALLGGWPGAALAQQMLRHKSKKQQFRVGFWFTVLVNLVGLYWLLIEGEQLLMRLLN